MENYMDIQKRGAFVGSGPDKSGNEVELFWAIDIEPPNRGFVAHLATAWRDGKPVGFLRPEYVDTAEHARFNPTVWTHMRSFGGFSGLDDGCDPSLLAGEEQAEFQRRAFHRLGFFNREAVGSYEEFMTVVEKTKAFREAVADLHKFMRYHADKPRVGYVCVRPTPRFPIESDNRGQGIGKLLYFATAVALDRMGLPFYSSTLQSPEAQRAWKGLETAGLATRHTVGGAKRMRLNAELIPCSLFEPADVARIDETEEDSAPGMR